MNMKETEGWLEKYRTPGEFPRVRGKGAVSISITSGKGGVGKTSMALKLGMELSKTDKKVLLIDCDFNLSNTLLKLNLPINDHFFDLLSSTKNFHECIYRKGNFHLLPGCNGSLSMFEGNFPLDRFVMDIMGEYEFDYDYIILDCPAGISEEILNINAFCKERFFILVPDKSSLTDSYSLMKILNRKYGIRENHMIVNRVISQKQYKRVVKSITQTAESFLACKIHVLGGVREYENKLECFDEIFLNNTNSLVHKNFLKVLEVYTEKHGAVEDSEVAAFRSCF